jgi:hypothetical protein
MDVRLLKINGIDAEIDQKTAIGITLQGYNVSKPGEKYVNTSNSFTIPNTAKNRFIFGNPADPQSENKQVYGFNYCDYWVGNDKLIDNAKVRLQDSGDRITCFIYEKNDFWDQAKKDLLIDQLPDLLTYLGLPVSSSPFAGSFSDFLAPYISAESGLILSNYFGQFFGYKSPGQTLIARNECVLSGGPANPVQAFLTVSSDYFADQTFTIIESPLRTVDEYAADFVNEIITSGHTINDYYNVTSNGGYIYLESIDIYTDNTLNISIQSTVLVTKLTSEVFQTGVPPTTFDLEESFTPPLDNGIEQSIRLRYTINSNNENGNGGHFAVFVKDLFKFIEQKYNVNFLTDGGGLIGNIWDDPIANKLYIPIREIAVVSNGSSHYFEVGSDQVFTPLTDQQDKADKTIFNLMQSFFQVMNIIKDELYYNGEKVFRLSRFDDLKNTAAVVNFSGGIIGQPKFKPFVEDYGQENFIKFSEIYPEGDELINSKKLTCSNLNLDATKDILEIDAYASSVVEVNSQFFLNLKDKESFKTFVFMLSDGYTSGNVAVYYNDLVNGVNLATSQPLQKAQLYDLNSEYNFLDEVITYPRVYEIEKWLTISDIRNFEFFKQYWIQELNGSYFVNKIEGFNPLSQKATKLELIKLSNKTPITPPDLPYWMDGVADPYTDGDGDYWTYSN